MEGGLYRPVILANQLFFFQVTSDQGDDVKTALTGDEELLVGYGRREEDFTGPQGEPLAA